MSDPRQSYSDGRQRASVGTYSLNVPVPTALRRVAARLEPALAAFDSVRDRPTLIIKRFTGDRSRGRIEAIVRETLAGAQPFELHTTGIGTFENPPSGSAPVVYLGVEGRGLRRVHARLVDRLGGVPGLEGDEYSPHVTLARGLSGSRADSVDREATAITRLRDRDIEPVTWQVDELGVWSREYREIVTRVPLPV